MKMISRTLAAMAAAAALSTAAQAGALVAADDFNGAASGWTGNWTTAAASIDNGALSFTGNSNSAATRTLAAPVTANRVVISYDVQFKSGSIDTNDFLALWLDSYSGPNVGVKGNCDGAAGCNDADLVVRTAGSGGSFTTPMTVGTTYHLFAVLDKINGASLYNRYSLWVDPTEAEMTSFTGADAISNGSTGLSSFSTVGFRSANLDAGDVITIDNLSISAIPEPGTFALAGLALFGLAAVRRKVAKQD